MDLRALSTVPWENIYHVGVVVPSIERGIEEVSKQLGVQFDAPRLLSVDLRDARGETRAGGVRLAYSHGRQPYLELLEETGDGVWTPEGGARLHHVGIWVADVVAESQRLIELGNHVEVFGSPTAGPKLFAYLSNDLGIRVELVAERVRHGMEERLSVPI